MIRCDLSRCEWCAPWRNPACPYYADCVLANGNPEEISRIAALFGEDEDKVSIEKKERNES